VYACECVCLCVYIGPFEEDTQLVYLCLFSYIFIFSRSLWPPAAGLVCVCVSFCVCVLCLSVQISSNNALFGDERALLDVYVETYISNVLKMLLPPAAAVFIHTEHIKNMLYIHV